MSKANPLFLKLSVAPETRSEESQGTCGHIKHFWTVFKLRLPELTKVNLYFMIFALPLFIAIVWGLPYFANAVAMDFNFSGNIGVGYPGASDDPILGQVAVLNVYLYFFLVLAGAFTILGLGLAGMYNCTKKCLWGEEFKITRTFFGGIAKYWWKMLLLMLAFGVIVGAGGVLVTTLVKLNVLGEASMLSWVLMIGALLLLLPNLLAIQYMLPMVVVYEDLKFFQIIKNGYILFLSQPIISIAMMVLYSIPIIFMVAIPFLGMFVYLLMCMFGFVFFGMANTTSGMFAFETYMNPLYKALSSSKSKGKVKSNGKNKIVAKKAAVKVNSNSQVAKVDNQSKATTVENKPANKPVNKPYNPKKQKKNENK